MNQSHASSKQTVDFSPKPEADPGSAATPSAGGCGGNCANCPKRRPAQKGQASVMAGMNMPSRKRGQMLTKSDLPALLCIAEENGMPLDISLFNALGGQGMELCDFVVKREGEVIELKSPRCRARLNLSEVNTVRAIYRGGRACGRLCVECFDCDARCLLTIAGPTLDRTPGGQVWHTLISTMALDARERQA